MPLNGLTTAAAGGSDDAVNGHVELQLVHEPGRCTGPGEQTCSCGQMGLQRCRGVGVIEADDLRPELGDLLTNHLP